MRKLFFDTNIFIDILFERDGFFLGSSKVYKLIEKDVIIGSISIISLHNIHYVARKVKSKDVVVGFIKKICKDFRFANISNYDVESAIDRSYKHFEDSIQYYSALSSDSDCIISRDKDGFKKSIIPVYSPDEYLEIARKNFESL